MASDINAVFIVGRLTKDPDLRYTASGTSVCSFSLANNRTYSVGGKKKEQVSYFNCVAWAKLGEIIAEYCKKGARLGIEGRLQQRSWEDSDGKRRYAVEIVITNFQFLSPMSSTKTDNNNSPAASDKESTPEPGPELNDDNNPFSDDNVPM